MVFAGGHQLAFLASKAIAITLLCIDFHQLQAQVAALRLFLDGLFQKFGSLIEATVDDMSLCLIKNVSRPFTHRLNDRHRRWRQHHAWRRNIDTVETVCRQIHVSGKLGFFGQRPCHTFMFVRRLPSIATSSQEQQQEQHNQQRATPDQPQHQRAGQQFVQRIICVFFFCGRGRRRGNRLCIRRCAGLRSTRWQGIFGRNLAWDLRRHIRRRRSSDQFSRYRWHGISGTRCGRTLSLHLRQLIIFQLDQAL